LLGKLQFPLSESRFEAEAGACIIYPSNLQRSLFRLMTA
jgi:hypothetical protein